MILLFRAFQEKDHVENFIKHGQLYCNPVKYFQGLNDSEGRGDYCDTISEMYQPEQITLTINGRPILDLKGPLAISDPDDYTHLFCLSCVEKESTPLQNNKIIDDLFRELGSWIAVVHKPKEFLFRASQHFKSKRDLISNYTFCKVNYVSEGYSGDMNTFTKRHIYNWQNEYRIALMSNKEEAITLNIGNISDIAEYFPMENFKNEVKNIGKTTHLIF